MRARGMGGSTCVGHARRSGAGWSSSAAGGGSTTRLARLPARAKPCCFSIWTMLACFLTGTCDIARPRRLAPPTARFPPRRPADGVSLVPVHQDCLMVQHARQFGIPAVSLVLGASYFQRLLVSRAGMRDPTDKGGLAMLKPSAARCAARQPNRRRRRKGRGRGGQGLAIPLPTAPACLPPALLGLLVQRRRPPLGMLWALPTHPTRPSRPCSPSTST